MSIIPIENTALKYSFKGLFDAQYFQILEQSSVPDIIFLDRSEEMPPFILEI